LSVSDLNTQERFLQQRSSHTGKHGLVRNAKIVFGKSELPQISRSELQECCEVENLHFVMLTDADPESGVASLLLAITVMV
jgi:hypothetical protein